jgi:mannose-6-phosphate isomerase-like protein (cupin superfamily)
MTAAVPDAIAHWADPARLELQFSFDRNASGWAAGPLAGMQSRDLGMAKSSRGAIATRHIRLAGKPSEAESDWLALAADFHFFLVLKGRARLENAAGQRMELDAGFAGWQPALLRHRMHDFSADFEMLEVTAPAQPRIIRGRDAPLPGAPGGPGRYLKETPESFVKGEGLRKFFAYRDLGTKDPTGGLVHIQVFKAVDIMPNGIGWHRHSDLRQFFWVLEGSAGFEVESRPDIKRIEPGDAVCMPAGFRHAVPSYTQDYKVVEMCIPGSYRTEDVLPPA